MGNIILFDINSSLPVILCELDSSGSLKKSYFHADGQILAQKDHALPDNTYYYVHDRLGSVRQVMAWDDSLSCLSRVHSYAFVPFGEPDTARCHTAAGHADNPFRFTGQQLDEEIAQYYLRARMYDPAMMRFMARDSAAGAFDEPMTLHKYLYCWNNPANLIDWTGEVPGSFGDVLATMSVRAFASGKMGFVVGIFKGLLVDVINGGGLDPIGILASGVDTAVASAIIGAGMGYLNPGYDQLIETLGDQLLFDVSIGLVAATAGELSGNSTEKMLKKNVAHVGAVNAMALSVELGW